MNKQVPTSGPNSRLAKILKQLTKNSGADDVHRLRTTIRRVEATLSASENKLAKQLAAIRKRSSKVRDLDVQAEALDSIQQPEYRRWRDGLMAQVQSERAGRARKLLKAVDRELEDGILKRLKNAQPDAPAGASGTAVAEAQAGFLRLTESIPTDEEQFHNLRLECKRVRYRLEQHGDPAEAAATLGSLKRVQDAIGHWHDWGTLRDRARESLGADARPLQAFLRARTQQLYQQARQVIGTTREMCAAKGKRQPASVRTEARRETATG